MQEILKQMHKFAKNKTVLPPGAANLRGKTAGKILLLNCKDNAKSIYFPKKFGKAVFFYRLSKTVKVFNKYFKPVKNGKENRCNYPQSYEI